MFSPYHKFNNCKRFEDRVNLLNKSSCVSTDAYQKFQTYHYALVHKLKSAEYFLSNLEDVLKTTAQSDTPIEIEFFFRTNLYIDGFFYCVGSSLDILAREILTYFGIGFPDRVYYETAHKEIKAIKPTDPILAKLDNPTWKKEFSDYRNATTHEVLLTGRVTMNVEFTGATVQKHGIVSPLPDDPREVQLKRTYAKNPDAFTYCKTTFKRVLSHINVIYGHIHDEALTNGKIPF